MDGESRVSRPTTEELDDDANVEENLIEFDFYMIVLLDLCLPEQDPAPLCRLL